MSLSEHALDAPDARATAAADLLARLSDAECGSVSEPALRQVVGAVLRLYEGACAHARGEISPVESDVSTTTAVTLACALVRSQSLTPFDFALWFAHTEVAGRGETLASATTSARTGDPRE